MAQLLYIALGFGVGLSAASAVGAIALLRWTGKSDENMPEAEGGTDAEPQASEPDSDQVAANSATLKRQGLTRITEDTIEASVNWMTMVDPSVTMGIIEDNWSGIAVEALNVDVDERDFVGLRWTSDFTKVETSFRDAQRDLETSSR